MSTLHVSEVQGFLSATSTPRVITGKIVNARIDVQTAARYLAAADESLKPYALPRTRKTRLDDGATYLRLTAHHMQMFSDYCKARAKLRSLYVEAEAAPVVG